MDSPISRDETATDAVHEWFRLLGRYCANEEYEKARAIVADTVVSFGTSANIVAGLASLEENQWANIWPFITDFSFDLDGVRAFGTTNSAWGVATWTSTGYHEDGESFHRPGRATVVVSRTPQGWQAIHTHFSLFPGTPQETFGPQ